MPKAEWSPIWFVVIVAIVSGLRIRAPSSVPPFCNIWANRV